jgi:hypothetical protein
LTIVAEITTVKTKLYIIITLLYGFLSCFSQTRKVQINPQIDQRLFHLGFMVGLNAQDSEITHNGYLTDDGETWFAEIPAYSPGFSVGIIGEMYLTNNLSLRTIPSLHFGERQLIFKESHTKEEVHFSAKSNYFTLPVDVKFSANRINNYRPYMIAGGGFSLDLTKKNENPFQLKTSDLFLEIGIGCDFYFPYFKFIPEIKFCFGLMDSFEHEPDLVDKSLYKYVNSIGKTMSSMIVLSFNFE